LCFCGGQGTFALDKRIAGEKEQATMSTITPKELAGKIGETIGTSEWILVDQEMINKFADATGDHQFIHVNEEAAKMTPFGGTIAHGFLTLSLMPVMSAKSDIPMIDGVKMGINYGGNKTRFLAPVKSGKRVRGHFKLLEFAEKRPGQWQQTMELSVEIEGEDKPALVAEWITQFFV
jgi:acyl dehydratase